MTQTQANLIDDGLQGRIDHSPEAELRADSEGEKLPSLSPGEPLRVREASFGSL